MNRDEMGMRRYPGWPPTAFLTPSSSTGTETWTSALLRSPKPGSPSRRRVRWARG